ncbi:Chaperone protein DnaJ [subsurface metagenome]
MFLFDREPLHSRRTTTHKYYQLLDIPRNASPADVKTNFKKLAQVYHPDKGGDPAKFVLLREAYEVLSNPKKRRLYDQHGDAGLEQLQDAERHQRPPTSSSIVLDLSLSEFYTGVSKQIPYSCTVICMNCAGKGSRSTISCAKCAGTGVAENTYQVGPMVFQNRGPCGACSGAGERFSVADRCPDCRGQRVVRVKKTLDVCVQPGTPVGHKLSFADAADQEPGRDTGDLVVVLQEEPHSIFRRVGDDLVASIDVSLATALCGESTSLELLDGQSITLEPPPRLYYQTGNHRKYSRKRNALFRAASRGGDTLSAISNFFSPKPSSPESPTRQTPFPQRRRSY